MTSVPVMSLGMRSGVNWMREKERESVRAIVEMSSVFARPGTPTTTACPRQKIAMRPRPGRQHLVDDLVLPDDDLVDLEELAEREHILDLAAIDLEDLVAHAQPGL
jgi:hypothetical protein